MVSFIHIADKNDENSVGLCTTNAKTDRKTFSIREKVARRAG